MNSQQLPSQIRPLKFNPFVSPPQQKDTIQNRLEKLITVNNLLTKEIKQSKPKQYRFPNADMLQQTHSSIFINPQSQNRIKDEEALFLLNEVNAQKYRQPNKLKRLPIQAKQIQIRNNIQEWKKQNKIDWMTMSQDERQITHESEFISSSNQEEPSYKEPLRLNYYRDQLDTGESKLCQNILTYIIKRPQEQAPLLEHHDDDQADTIKQDYNLFVRNEFGTDLNHTQNFQSQITPILEKKEAQMLLKFRRQSVLSRDKTQSLVREIKVQQHVEEELYRVNIDSIQMVIDQKALEKSLVKKYFVFTTALQLQSNQQIGRVNMIFFKGFIRKQLGVEVEEVALTSEGNKQEGVALFHQYMKSQRQLLQRILTKTQSINKILCKVNSLDIVKDEFFQMVQLKEVQNFKITRTASKKFDSYCQLIILKLSYQKIPKTLFSPKMKSLTLRQQQLLRVPYYKQQADPETQYTRYVHKYPYFSKLYSNRIVSSMPHIIRPKLYQHYTFYKLSNMVDALLTLIDKEGVLNLILGPETKRKRIDTESSIYLTKHLRNTNYGYMSQKSEDNHIFDVLVPVQLKQGRKSNNPADRIQSDHHNLQRDSDMMIEPSDDSFQTDESFDQLHFPVSVLHNKLTLDQKVNQLLKGVTKMQTLHEQQLHEEEIEESQALEIAKPSKRIQSRNSGLKFTQSPLSGPSHLILKLEKKIGEEQKKSSSRGNSFEKRPVGDYFMIISEDESIHNHDEAMTQYDFTNFNSGIHDLGKAIIEEIETETKFKVLSPFQNKSTPSDKERSSSQTSEQPKKGKVKYRKSKYVSQEQIQKELLQKKELSHKGMSETPIPTNVRSLMGQDQKIEIISYPLSPEQKAKKLSLKVPSQKERISDPVGNIRAMTKMGTKSSNYLEPRFTQNSSKDFRESERMSRAISNKSSVILLKYGSSRRSTSIVHQPSFESQFSQNIRHRKTSGSSRDRFNHDISEQLATLVNEGNHASLQVFQAQNRVCDLGNILNTYKDANGNTLLMKAIMKGDLNSIKVLLQMGPDLNIQNAEGNTALHLAGSMKQWKIVEILLQNGAKEQILNNRGQSPWEIVR